MIYFEVGYFNTRSTPNSTIILTSCLNRGLDIYQGGDGDSSKQRRLTLTKVSNTQLKLTAYDCSVTVYKIIGIKL